MQSLAATLQKRHFSPDHHILVCHARVGHSCTVVTSFSLLFGFPGNRGDGPTLDQRELGARRAKPPQVALVWHQVGAQVQRIHTETCGRLLSAQVRPGSTSHSCYFQLMLMPSFVSAIGYIIQFIRNKLGYSWVFIS